jgi:lipopolysaccharide export system permease protein
MSMKITLFKYILNEIWPTYLTCLLVCVFLVLGTKMLSITDLVVEKGIPVTQIWIMFLYLLPDIMLFALPAASLVSVVLAFLRFSVDSEIIALKSCGISLYQMLPPVIILSSVGLLLAAVVSFIGVPWGNSSFKNLLVQLTQTNLEPSIRERTFCEPIRGIELYVKRFSETEKEMEDVFVSDKRNDQVTNTIVAEKGRISYLPKDKMITFRFRNGTIFVVGRDLQSGRTIKFKTYDLSIDLKEFVSRLESSRTRHPKEMTLGQLIKEAGNVLQGAPKYNEIMLELLEKFTVPLAVFLMGIIGVPLGSQLRSKGRSLGIGVSLAVFFSYYLCLAGMRSICETGLIPPIIGVWVPNLFLLVSGIFLLKRVANERPIYFYPRFLRQRLLSRE